LDARRAEGGAEARQQRNERPHEEADDDGARREHEAAAGESEVDRGQERPERLRLLNLGPLFVGELGELVPIMRGHRPEALHDQRDVAGLGLGLLPSVAQLVQILERRYRPLRIENSYLVPVLAVTAREPLRRVLFKINCRNSSSSSNTVRSIDSRAARCAALPSLATLHHLPQGQRPLDRLISLQVQQLALRVGLVTQSDPPGTIQHPEPPRRRERHRPITPRRCRDHRVSQPRISHQNLLQYE
jgi:hypothetical protein